MAELKIGSVVRSKAGNDKDKLYVVIKFDDKFAYISDGVKYTVAKPSKKNVKHLAVLNGDYRDNVPFYYEGIYDRWTDEDIRRALKYRSGKEKNV